MDIYRTKQSPSGMLLILARAHHSNNSPGPSPRRPRDSLDSSRDMALSVMIAFKLKQPISKIIGMDFFLSQVVWACYCNG